MKTATKVVGYFVGVAAVFGAAVGVGAAAGPLDDDVSASIDSMADHGTGDDSDAGHQSMSGDSGTPGEIQPGGLMISQNGYTLAVSQSRLPAKPDVALRFRILGPDGEPVTEYAKEHGKDLHLIVVRRDMVGYQHVHPTLDRDGQWSVDVDLSAAGEYRAFADFAPAGGEGLTLGADVSASGAYEPRALPEPARSVQVGDYTVEVDGELVPGETSPLTLTVSKNGKQVRDLQPYLEAYGHLVALRDGDLAYLHVHPDGSPGDGSTEPGPRIRFFAEVPSTGRYRLFLDFKHDGEVRTAEFTMIAGPQDGAGTTDQGEPAHGHDG